MSGSKLRFGPMPSFFFFVINNGSKGCVMWKVTMLQRITCSPCQLCGSILLSIIVLANQLQTTKQQRGKISETLLSSSFFSLLIYIILITRHLKSRRYLLIKSLHLFSGLLSVLFLTEYFFQLVRRRWVVMRNVTWQIPAHCDSAITNVSLLPPRTPSCPPFRSHPHRTCWKRSWSLRGALKSDRSEWHASLSI